MTDPQGGVADQELGRVIRDGFQKIADSWDVALATVAVTSRVIREVGVQERRARTSGE